MNPTTTQNFNKILKTIQSSKLSAVVREFASNVVEHKVQTSNILHNDIKTLLQNARNMVYTTINCTMAETYSKSEIVSAKFKLGCTK